MLFDILINFKYDEIKTIITSIYMHGFCIHDEDVDVYVIVVIDISTTHTLEHTPKQQPYVCVLNNL